MKPLAIVSVLLASVSLDLVGLKGAGHWAAAAKYGDLAALIRLAKRPPWVVDEKGLPDWLN